jgi:hypothetical protein
LRNACNDCAELDSFCEGGGLEQTQENYSSRIDGKIGARDDKISAPNKIVTLGVKSFAQRWPKKKGNENVFQRKKYY